MNPAGSVREALNRQRRGRRGRSVLGCGSEREAQRTPTPTRSRVRLRAERGNKCKEPGAANHLVVLGFGDAEAGSTQFFFDCNNKPFSFSCYTHLVSGIRKLLP